MILALLELLFMISLILNTQEWKLNLIRWGLRDSLRLRILRPVICLFMSLLDGIEHRSLFYCRRSIIVLLIFGPLGAFLGSCYLWWRIMGSRWKEGSLCFLGKLAIHYHHLNHLKWVIKKWTISHIQYSTNCNISN